MDTVAYEIIRSGLYAAAREMKVAMMRTAASPIIHSGGDASAAIFDATSSSRTTSISAAAITSPTCS
jgi:N-methylhydantoinase B/oxoprolinase/acetone carboxylase alpha subunit